MYFSKRVIAIPINLRPSVNRDVSASTFRVLSHREAPPPLHILDIPRMLSGIYGPVGLKSSGHFKFQVESNGDARNAATV